jgi:UDP-glucose 4-epimerase
MIKRILVTGGAGFVGSHLVARLLGGSDSVTVLDDLSRGKEEWLDDGARLFRADIRDAERVSEVVEEVRPTHLVHLAALHFIPAVDEAPALARAINVDGTATLLNALRVNPPKVIVFASTAAVYPDTPGPIDETRGVAPIDLYGRTKVEGEALLRAYADRQGVNVVLTRLFNVVGRRETNPHVLPEIVDQLRRGSDKVRLGALETRRDYVNAEDVASALHALLDRQPDGVSSFNVGTGRGVSVREIVEICGTVLGRSVQIEQDPSRLRQVDRAELIADASLIGRQTGWKPTWSIEDTLADLLLSGA